MSDLREELREAIAKREDAARARHGAGLAYAGSLRQIDPLTEALAAAEEAAELALGAAELGEGTQAAAASAVCHREAAREALERAEAASKLLKARQAAAEELHTRAAKAAAVLVIARAKLLVSAGAAELRASLERAAEIRYVLLGVGNAAQRANSTIHPLGDSLHEHEPIPVTGRASWFGVTEALDGLGLEGTGRPTRAKPISELDLLGDELAALLHANP